MLLFSRVQKQHNRLLQLLAVVPAIFSTRVGCAATCYCYMGGRPAEAELRLLPVVYEPYPQVLPA